VKERIDLSAREWVLAGFTPFAWHWKRHGDVRAADYADVPAIAARVPGSVQKALLDAGVIPDWNEGYKARDCEWVENRHWVYQVALGPYDLPPGRRAVLTCLGLDWAGSVFVNGVRVGDFRGAFTPHVFDLTAHLGSGQNLLQILFEAPPRWLGQITRTSTVRDWKPRFNYGWDWTSRIVQIGIWDGIYLDMTDDAELTGIDCSTGFDVEAAAGTLTLRGEARGPVGARVRARLSREGRVVREASLPAESLSAGFAWNGLDVEPWWPNGDGAQPLYALECELIDTSGAVADGKILRVGFKNVQWRPCEGAPAGADPWLCVVNGRPVFLRGVNWTPIRPNFADVAQEDYAKRLRLYRDLGMNTLRVWGGAFLEKECFYRLCDEMGFMVWQEFPLSSSGIDNRPPDDGDAIKEACEIARSYIERRRGHVSLLLWCGGNELICDPDAAGRVQPLDVSHPMISGLAETAALHDPQRRFLATSPSGPRVWAGAAEYGRGVHWDVHGPWEMEGPFDEWEAYWRGDDALFRSETGCPSASSAHIIRRYAGNLPELPATRDNPLWRRTWWWIDWPHFIKERGREPRDLDEYVAWSQGRQAKALAAAVRPAVERFPRCGGILIWMGHDSFPCTANTSIVDFEGDPKPAALALGAIFRAIRA
jgi:beta-mannosidase